MGTEDLSPIQKAALLIENLKARISRLESGQGSRDVAVVGMGCAFPGDIHSPQELWEKLLGSVDTVTPLPAGRFAMDPDKVAYGSFIRDVDAFDAEFFHIPRREAPAMDPQQRLLLQTSWHALEDAGLLPGSLSGTKTGVFIGAMNYDYSEWSYTPEDIDIYTGSGTSNSILAGRLAYFYDCKGPAMTIDTACSSSLVAIHQAVRSIRSGESDLCLVGGVNAILSPTLYQIEWANQMLAGDGKCKTFDAAADGFVRAEGCGVVVLKPLQAALRDGNRIYCVIKGSAVNHDGRSSGLMAPNQSAQEALLRTALEDSGLERSEIGFVECHGTGTRLGDPVEAGALRAVYRDRGTEPLYIGSLKSNFGHLEGAAGIGGFMKLALSLHHRTIAPSLHFHDPNPLIDWSRLSVPQTPVGWGGGPASGGVSSFGFSGTNAHVIASSFSGEGSPVSRSNHLPIVVSAATRESFHGQLQEVLDHEGLSDDQRFTLSVQRSLFPFRKVFFEHLGPVDPQPALDEVIWGRDRPPVYFLFSGQGAQFPGMGASLYGKHPVFRKYLDACAAAYASITGKSLLDLLFHADQETLASTENTQPAIFSVSYAIAKCWEHHGLEPKALVGHSIGEWAAACFAGMLDLEDAMRLIIRRGELMAGAPPGKMVALRGSLEDISGYPGISFLNTAAINGGQQIVLSGRSDAMMELERYLSEKGVSFRTVNEKHAFHSRLMASASEEFREDVEAVTFRASRYPIHSNLDGRPITPDRIGDHYWSSQMVSTVDFLGSIASLEHDSVVLEMGPGNTLVSLAGREKPQIGHARFGLATATNPGGFYDTFAYLFERGMKLSLQPFFEEGRYRTASAPLYRFVKERFWIRETVERRLTRGSTPSHDASRYIRQWREVMPREPFAKPSGKQEEWIVAATQSVQDVQERFLEFVAHYQKLDTRDLSSLVIDLSQIDPTLQESYGLGFTGFLQSAFLERQHGLHSVVFLYEPGAGRPFVLDGRAHGVYKVQDGRLWECVYVKEDEAGDAFVIDYRHEEAYVVDGASGSLGLSFIRFLVDKGVNRFCLMGRRSEYDLSDDHRELLDKIRSAGGTVRYFATGTDLDTVFRSIEEPLGGIFHLAGTYSNLAIPDFSPEAVASVLQPKVERTMQLYDKAIEYKARFFMGASSAVTMTGAPYLGHYAFANGWMEGLEERGGVPVCTIAWGGWSGSNMIREGSNEQFQREWGFRSTAPEAMLGSWESARKGCQAVVDIAWNRYFTMAPNMKLYGPLKGFCPGGGSEDIQPKAEYDAGQLEDILRKAISDILQDKPERIDFKKPFEESGFNSLLAIELSNRINASLGLSVSSTIIYAHPTPGQLLRFLQAEHLDQGKGKDEALDRPGADDDLLDLQRMLEEKLNTGKR